MPETPVIRYLNTDLDLICDFDPAILVAELEAHELAVIVNRGEDGPYHILCEDANDTQPEPNIIRLLDSIDSLSGAASEVWEMCSKREFNIGYDCGDEPWAFNQGLSNEVLRRIAQCGATLRITLYPHSPEPDENNVPISA